MGLSKIPDDSAAFELNTSREKEGEMAGRCRNSAGRVQRIRKRPKFSERAKVTCLRGKKSDHFYFKSRTLLADNNVIKIGRGACVPITKPNLIILPLTRLWCSATRDRFINDVHAALWFNGTAD